MQVSIAAATSLTVPPQAGYAIVQVKGGTGSYTTDGTTTPTTALGMTLPVGAALSLSGPDVLGKFKIIGAAGVTLDVEYYR